MKQKPLHARSRFGDPEIPRLLWNLNIHHCVQNSLLRHLSWASYIHFTHSYIISLRSTYNWS